MQRDTCSRSILDLHRAKMCILKVVVDRSFKSVHLVCPDFTFHFHISCTPLTQKPNLLSTIGNLFQGNHYFWVHKHAEQSPSNVVHVSNT